MRILLVALAASLVASVALSGGTARQWTGLSHLSIDEMRSEAGALGSCAEIRVIGINDCWQAAKNCDRFTTCITCNGGMFYSECPMVEDAWAQTSVPVNPVEVFLDDCPQRLSGECQWSNDQCLAPGPGGPSLCEEWINADGC